jgi:hypothetical protein
LPQIAISEISLPLNVEHWTLNPSGHQSAGGR